MDIRTTLRRTYIRAALLLLVLAPLALAFPLGQATPIINAMTRGFENDRRGRCTHSPLTVTSDQGPQALSDLAITFITEGNPPPRLNRFVKIEVSADVGVDAGAELRVSYRLDAKPDHSLPAQERRDGPANFANHQEFFETHTTTAMMPVSQPDNYTLTPILRVSGPSGASAQLLTRCIAVDPNYMVLDRDLGQ